MERRILYVLTIVLISALALSGAIYAVARDKPKSTTEEESKKLAEDFVRNSATYRFDGYSLKHSETLYPDLVDKPYLWTFVFEFESDHAGYGDRSGKDVAQVITPHEAHVTVDTGRVNSAILDMKWDMLEQKPIETE